MHIDFLTAEFLRSRSEEALIWNSRVCTYGMLLDSLGQWPKFLNENGIRPGACVSLEADFSPNSVGLMLALIERGCIQVPMAPNSGTKKEEYRKIAEVEFIISVDADDRVSCSPTGCKISHPMLKPLQDAARPSLIVFSSGSTGQSKAAVHDFLPLLEKFKISRQKKRMISFLLFDHLGGINTMLYCLSNGGCMVILRDRSPRAVVAAIEAFKVQILPTSPTFLNLLLMSQAYQGHDLASLELITYGTEPMPESTLSAVHRTFPNVTLQQTYGLSELGVLRSKSRSSDSLWVKVGGEGFETRIVEGLLEIKSKSAMLGYLNAASPFTEDGWFMTGDAVVTDGDWIRILGRKSEIINVGGEKVFPAEIESVIQGMDGVVEVVVKAEANPIMGSIVKAVVKLQGDETLEDFRKRMRLYCKDRLPNFKIPQKVVLKVDDLHSDRFKKLRSAE